MLVAGWKSVSTIDVKGHTSFVLWLCGCNLKCPFCHNWMIANAHPMVCREISVDAVLQRVLEVKNLIDYVHVTGGEPLVQHQEVRELFVRVKEQNLRTSLNSNLTLYDALKQVIDVVDHIATDLRPPTLYGVNDGEKLFENFLKSLKLAADSGIAVELRVPVLNIDIQVYREYLAKALKVLEGGRFYVRFIWIRGRPFTEPREPEFCEKHCYSSISEFLSKAAELKQILPL